MLQLGRINCLPVVEVVEDGYYLKIDSAASDSVWAASTATTVFLSNDDLYETPSANKNTNHELKQPLNIGDELDVFVYKNSKDELVATTQTPTAQVGECAYLTVLSVNDYGAFLDWGLPKDILLPFAEQAYPVTEGRSYVVYVYIDERSDRVACTTKLHDYLPETATEFKPRQPVDLLIAAKSELGYKAVINGKYLGLIFHEDLSQPLQFGARMKGWIKTVRDDGKIDLNIHSLDSYSRNELAERILAYIDKSGGRAKLSDKSSPEEIFRIFKVSKKNFKRALSDLYKKRLIRIESDFIEQVE